MSFLEFANHVYFFPSLLVGSFFLATLVVLGEKKKMKEVLFWGVVFSLCPYMILSDAIYHGTMALITQVFGSVPLLLDVIVDYVSRIVLIPVSMFICYRRLTVHWSLSLFMLTTFVGIGYLGMVVGKTQIGAFLVDAVAILLWWKLIWSEIMYNRETRVFLRFGFLGFVRALD